MKKIFRFLWKNKLVRFLTNKYIITIIAALLVWKLFVENFVPVIDEVNAIQVGDTLFVKGRNFGSERGRSTLHLNKKQLEDFVTQNVFWSDTLLKAIIPDKYAGSEIILERFLLFFPIQSDPVPTIVQLGNLPSAPYGYEVPVLKSSPWPTFRRDHRNTGYFPFQGSYKNDSVWSFQTGKGIFSTPVLDVDGNVYVGSADHYFYSISKRGNLNWKFKTGEIIDSGGGLTTDETGEVSVIVPSGDGYLYKLSTQNNKTDLERIIWKFDSRVSKRESYNNWFEGNIQFGFDGTIYAGNTNFNYYALHADGRLKWTYQTNSNNWSIAAIANDGTIYWGSNDALVHAVRPDGVQRWNKITLGFIAASAAIGSDGTVYIGSFDSYLYALNPTDGSVKWKFKTNDHIYASVALVPDSTGKTNMVYLASTDGNLYALDTRGQLRWKYDTNSPIRSSPVVGDMPGQPGKHIVYFGAGDGCLYAINSDTGLPRWVFNTTSSDPVLSDRNDLNASPALSHSGIYIGGEHGQVWYIPYDYPLYNSADKRCLLPADIKPLQDGAYVSFVSPGGNDISTAMPVFSVSSIITLKLQLVKGAQTVDAWFNNSPFGMSDDDLVVKITPQVDFVLEKSADAHYLHIRPQTFMNADTEYTISIEGNYYTGGYNFGNLSMGGSEAGRLKQQLRFRTTSNKTDFPLVMTDTSTNYFEWTRLAVPIPPMMPSLNQIGFDYMDWIVTPIYVSKPDDTGAGKWMALIAGAKRNENNELQFDPKSEFLFPMQGSYRNNAFILENQGMIMPVTGIPIPFNLLELRGEFEYNTTIRQGATMYADTKVLSIPTFGKYLVAAGLANDVYKKLLVTGTFITQDAASSAIKSNKVMGIELKEAGVVQSTATEKGRLWVELNNTNDEHIYPSQHRFSIILVDTERMIPLYINYAANTTVLSTNAGDISKIVLELPEKFEFPAQWEAWVMQDASIILKTPIKLLKKN